MRHPNVTAFYFATLLRLTPTMEKFPWDDLRKILQSGQRMANVQNIEEISPKLLTSEYGARTLQTTDNRRTCDSKDPNVMHQSIINHILFPSQKPHKVQRNNTIEL